MLAVSLCENTDVMYCNHDSHLYVIANCVVKTVTEQWLKRHVAELVCYEHGLCPSNFSCLCIGN